MLDWLSKQKSSPMAQAFATEYPMVATGQAGFLVGTMVATTTGWRPVETLSAGDDVLTFDHGMRPIKSTKRDALVFGQNAAAHDLAPVYIPRDALGNRNPMWVKPEQGILIEHDLLEDSLGDPFAVVPACALEGYRGIARTELQPSLQTVSILFDEDEVIYIEAGVLGFCPAVRDLMDYCESGQDDGIYTVLSPCEARELVIDMITDDSFWTPGAIAGSGGHGEPHFAAQA